MLFEKVKGAFYLDTFPQEKQLPVGGKLGALFGVWWRKDVGSVPVPHLPSHDTSVVGTIANGDGSSVIHKIGYLLGIVLIGGSKA